MGVNVRLTPTFFHVLLALADGPRHGYALVSEIEARSAGRIRPGPSSLYYALDRLEEAGLIREADGSFDPDEPHEQQRRYFELTPGGRARVADEVAVLDGIVEHARSVGVQSRSAG